MTIAAGNEDTNCRGGSDKIIEDKIILGKIPMILSSMILSLLYPRNPRLIKTK
jgi:hypothetical protein